jgi:hypothetical protein
MSDPTGALLIAELAIGQCNPSLARLIALRLLTGR